MGKLYTSYYKFASMHNVDNTLYVQVSNTVPKWWDWGKGLISFDKESPIIPLWDWVEEYKNQNITFETFSNRYYTTLANRKNEVDGVVEKIKTWLTTHNVVLLCHEKDVNSCHRSILAKFLKNIYGIESDELTLEMVQ